MPHPPSHMEKEGGSCKGLKTTIKKGITIFERMARVIIIINEV
jgi:hypothetical protein